MSAPFDNGLRASPFDVANYKPQIDWGDVRKAEADSKSARARVKKSGTTKLFLVQPPHYRESRRGPRPSKVVRTPRPAAKPKRVSIPWVKPEQITAASTVNGRRLDSKAGLMRLAMLKRGPMTSTELAAVADVKTGRMARDLLGYDISKGIVKVQKDVEPVRYYVAEHPPTLESVL